MEKNRLFTKKYGSGIDYSSISNIEQLHAARERLRNMIELKEYEFEGDVRAFKEALNPVTYINRLITKLYSLDHLVKYFVQGYDFVRNWFNGKREEYYHEHQGPSGQSGGTMEADGAVAEGAGRGVKE